MPSPEMNGVNRSPHSPHSRQSSASKDSQRAEGSDTTSVAPAPHSALELKLGEPIPATHRDYYFEDGNVTFLVEETLFKIHRSMLTRRSPFFHDMFAAPPSPNKLEGATDGLPIILPHITIAQFEHFLSALYPSWRPEPHSTEALISILSLSTKWLFETIRAYAIELLTSRRLSPILRVELARAYDIPAWLLSAFLELSRRRTPLAELEAERLGLPTVLRLSKARETIIHRRFVRAIEPPAEEFFQLPMVHHPNCWKGLARALGLALMQPESEDDHGDIIESILRAFRSLEDERLCDACNVITQFRPRCAAWLDLEGDLVVVSKLFGL